MWFTILISFVNEREICAICKILPLGKTMCIQSLSHMTVTIEVRSFCWVRLHDPLYNFMLIGENLLHVHTGSFNFQEQATMQNEVYIMLGSFGKYKHTCSYYLYILPTLCQPTYTSPTHRRQTDKLPAFSSEGASPQPVSCH